jgi:uncharacterized protein YndB with AHSA1/START domain
MAKPQDISLSLVRTIRAAPEKVYAAWTDPETLKRWMAPREEMTVEVAETDVRIGGKYRILMREPDGGSHGVIGVYRILEPGRKLAFTWAWETAPEKETLVTIDFREVDAGTELTLTHTKFAEETVRDRHNQGWMGCVGRLEKLFAA